jgi:phosphomannomutase/phosphoglucomutase
MKFSFKKDDSSGSQFTLPPALMNPMLFMGAGVAVMLLSGVMLFSGSGSQRDNEKAFEQGQRAVTQLSQNIQSFRRMLSDEQVISLASMAIENPDNEAELSQYLAGRMSEFRSVRLFDPSDYLSSTQSIGENAWIAIHMMVSAAQDGIAPIQLVPQAEDSAVAGLVSVGEGEDRVGYLLVTADSEVVLSGFDMTLPAGGYIGLEQDNGRFTPSTISAFGDPSELAAGAVRLPVPGSLFRIVVPQVAGEAGGGGFGKLLMFLLGALLLAVGMIIRQRTMHPVTEFKTDPASQELAAAEMAGDALHQQESDADFESEPAEAQASIAEEPAPEVSLPDISLRFEKKERKLKKARGAPVELTPEIFRAYDIRGIVGKTLDEAVARRVGQAVGTLALEEDASPVVVGRDGRHSGPDLVEGMIAGISSTGCDVIDIGAVPTGVLYYTAYESGSGSGVMVTGSHNPPDYNGFKVMMGGRTLAQENITGLYDRLKAGNLRIGKGKVTRQDMLEAYRDRIAGDIQLKRPLKVVADCGNGIGGICAADVLRSIGAEVLPMFDDVDGDFPNHHPDPSEPENLQDLISTVGVMNADLGVAFDGDADRLGVVTPDGEIISADRMMILFAREILSRNPGAKIIYDVKCTGKLDAIIREAGGEPEMYKTGHSLIKNRMKEVDAPFAGEMSGHFFFTDRWYGFDCGIYSAARLLEILAMREETPEQVLSSLPKDISTPELKVHMNEGENHEFIERFQQEARFADARVSTIDGVRVDYDYGWGLVRASNTTPILVVRFEADSNESMQIIQEAFRLQMLSIREDLELPF